MRYSSGAVLAVLAVLVGTGCSPASMTTVQHSGTSVNYKFESSKWVDKETKECRRIEVRVRAKAKLYTNAKEPPSRLTMIDTDCEMPFQIEQARYVDEGGVFVSGSAMNRFRSRYRDLFQELYGYIGQVLDE